MKLLVGVLVSLLSLSALADDVPNGIICGEVQFIDGAGLEIGDPKPVSNGFVLTGTSVLHGDQDYALVGKPDQLSKVTIRKYYQVALGNVLAIADEPNGRVTVTVDVKKVFKQTYTSCTYLYNPDELRKPNLGEGKVSQAVYRF